MKFKAIKILNPLSVLLLLFLITEFTSNAQLTVDFRVVSLSSDVDDMDLAGGGTINGGPSDPVWEYSITDVPFATLGQGVYAPGEINCPGTTALTDVFFTQTYAAGCNTPTDYTLELSAADKDNGSPNLQTGDDAYANFILNIPALSLTYPSGGFIPLGTYTLTAPGTDCGSTGTVTWTFVIEYQTVGQTEFVAPTISCLPGTVTQNVDPGLCSAVITGIAPLSTTDNCGVAEQTWIMSGATVDTSGNFGIFDASGEIFNEGVTTVTYTVSDYSSNTASCSFTVTVIDNEPPSVTCPNDTTVNVTTACTADVNGISPTVVDNCVHDLQTWNLTGATTGTSPITGINDVSGQFFNAGITTITYNVEDPGGNSASCNFTVTVLDAVLPTITCPTNFTVPVDAGLCGANVTYFAPVGLDNCPGPSTSLIAGQASATVFPVGTTTVTYEVTDASANTAQCSFDVIVIDNEDPTITCPADIPVQNTPGLCERGVGYASPVGVDNCAGSITTLIAGLPSGSNFPVGTTVNTFEVVDASGNSVQCSFNIIVSDTENPTISCPANINQNNDPGLCGATVNFAAVVGTDNCPGSITSLISALGPGDFYPVGTSTVTYEVVDPSGNSAQCSFNVDVVDNENPTITCPANISVGNDPGSCDAVVNYVAPIGSDNCPGATTAMIGGLASGSVFPLGTTTITYEVTDGVGNTNQCSFDVVVNDTENPTITCPAIISVNNDVGSCGAIVNYAAVVTSDNCPGETASLISGQLSGTLFPIGTTTVTYEVIDAVSNTAQCSFDVSVSDIEVPTISCPANITLNNDPGICAAAVFYTAPVGVDNCPGSITSLIAGQNSGTSFPVGTTTVTFEVIDASFNSAQCSFDITVNDTENPALTCPADITMSNTPGNCGSIVNYVSPVGTDNCPGAFTNLIAGQASGSFFNVGTTAITFETTDASGNATQCSFNVTVNDVENPTITCPGNLNVNNDFATCGAVVSYTAPVDLDNCPGPITSLTSGLASGSLFPIGTTNIVYEVADAYGNTNSCSFDVTVNDNTNPAITCPGNITATNDAGLCGAIVNYTAPVGTDNCPGSVTSLISGQASGTLFPVGITTVQYEVVDGSGNNASCSFDVTVQDLELPSITCPADINANSDPGLCGAVVTYTAPIGTDNCPGSITNLTAGQASGTVFSTGTTVVTYEVIDVSANSSQCSFNVTIIDTEIPAITCPANMVVANDPGSCDAVVNYVAPIGSDNCPGATTAMIGGLASGSVFPLGTTTITYEVTDGVGNTNQCSFDVVVNDTENPTITCPSDITTTNDPGLCSATITYTAPIGTDNCPGVVTNLTTGFTSGSSFSGGVTVVTYEAIDVAGNSSQCSFIVNVIDTEVPTATCPADIISANDPGLCGAIINYADPVITDNCPTGSGLFTVISGFASGDEFPVGTTTVSIGYSDVSGNLTTCNFNVTVVDNEPPVLSCPVDQSVIANASCEFVLADYTTLLLASDNCGSYSVSQIPAPGFIASATQAVTLIATDQYGNLDSCSFQVTAIDNTAPILNCPSSYTVYRDSLCEYDVNDLIGVIGITENCNTYTYTQTPALGTILTADSMATLIVTDVAGNSSSCSFNLELTDTMPPIVTCPVDLEVFFSSICDFVIQDYSLTISTWDNCGFASLTQDPLPGTAITGNTDVNITGIDINGNSNACSFTVIPKDTVPPMLACPPDQTINVNDSCMAVLQDYTGLATVITTCENIPLTQSPPPGTTVSADLTIVLSGSDVSGNLNACTFNLSLVDTIPPEVTCPSSIFSCDSLVDYPIPTATDNCVVQNLVRTAGPPTGSIFPPGSTWVTYEATDAFGNTDQCSFTVNIVPAPVLSATAIDISCNGAVDGAIDVTTTDGSIPFVYVWSNGETTEDIDTLTAGTYTVIVVDKYGCSDTLIDSIIEPEILESDYDISTIGCYGTTDGYISLYNVQGGTTPYNFFWDPPVGAGTNATDLFPGSYDISVVDGNGCFKDTTIIIQVSDSIVINSEVSIYDYGFNISEEDGNDGWISLDVTGGTQPYTYVWDHGDNDAYINGLLEGTYTVIVYDEYDCEATATFILIEPLNINVQTGISPNGDGINDILLIENIEHFPKSQLIIMNRWGDIVYEKIGYQNDWDGTANKGLVMYGKKVPEGSYFYTLDPNEEPYEKLSGYIIVNDH